MSSTSPSTVEVLRAARDLISDPARWTTECFARNGSGKSVDPRAASACSWCALGAIIHVSAESDDTVAQSPFAQALERDSPVSARHEPDEAMTVSQINDLSGHEATLAMFDRAIAAEQERDHA